MAGEGEELLYVSHYSPVESFSCECEKFIAGKISMKISPSSPARQMRCMKMGRRAPDLNINGTSPSISWRTPFLYPYQICMPSPCFWWVKQTRINHRVSVV